MIDHLGLTDTFASGGLEHRRDDVHVGTAAQAPRSRSAILGRQFSVLIRLGCLATELLQRAGEALEFGSVVIGDEFEFGGGLATLGFEGGIGLNLGVLEERHLVRHDEDGLGAVVLFAVSHAASLRKQRRTPRSLRTRIGIMPGRSRVLEREIIPSWITFIRGLLQGPQARHLLAEGLMRAGSDNFRTVFADVRTMTLVDSRQYPGPEKIWRIAAALRHKVGHGFCHGPLALYAAGHFVEFINVMILARLDTTTKEVLIGVLDDVIATATAPVLKNESDDHVHLNVGDMAREQRNFWYDEETPKVTADFEEAFECAWVLAQGRPALPDHHDIKVAMMAAKSINEPLADRRSIVRRALLRYVDHLQRMERINKGYDPWVIPERLSDEADALDQF